MKIKILYIVLFMFLLYVCLYYYRDNKSFNKYDLIDNITFLDKNETYDKIKNNHVFRETLYKKHYKVRNAENWEDYMYLIRNSFSDFTKKQKEKLIRCSSRADRKLLLIRLKGFDGLKASKMPWYFGLSNSLNYEEGLPHTVGNAIILYEKIVDNYNDKNLINTLIHEKVHIYQKMYPEDVAIYLRENGFEKVKRVEESDDIRVNPDISMDNYIYFNRNQNRYYAGIKNRDKINSSQNTMEEILYEHPFENMAIIIEKISKTKNISRYDF